MKKLIATTILAAILPAYFASAADNTTDNTDGKPKQHQGGKCHGKDGNGKPKKKGKPGADAPKNNN